MITAIRPYFRSIMKDLGFKEWKRSLEPDQIPKTLTEEIFHLKTENVSAVKQNQRDIETQVRVQLTFGKRGNTEEVSAYEKAEQSIQDILTAALSPTNKAASGFLNIQFLDAVPEAISAQNDNILLSRMTFLCTVILEV